MNGVFLHGQDHPATNQPHQTSSWLLDRAPKMRSNEMTPTLKLQMPRATAHRARRGKADRCRQHEL